MIRKQCGHTFWYEFDILQGYPSLRHGCFIHPSLYQDEQLTEIKAALFGKIAGSVIDANQVHEADVSIVDSTFVNKPVADSLVTSVPNIALLIKHADCQSCLLFDPEHRVIANVHSGWRGSAKNIYRATIEKMHVHWKTRPEALLACIGPSLGPCHAEFLDWEKLLPPSFAPFRRADDHFDFWAISRHQLLSCGLAPLNIEIARICTYCHPEQFFSYRRDKTVQRHATCIALIDQS